jgi:hypothetical protein
MPTAGMATAAVFLAGLLGACGGNSGAHSSAAGSSSTSGHGNNAPEGTLQLVNRPVTAAELAQGMKELFRNDPGITAFDIQDVQYTAKSMAAVLANCTSGGSPTTSSQVQSGHLLACAPLVFFLYSYGQQKSERAASELADDIYSYAINDIQGPLDSSSVLGAVLEGWGVHMGAVATVPRAPKMSPAETALVTASEKAILAKGSVHLVVSGYTSASKAPSETIVADIGTASANETLVDGSSRAQIRLTPQDAYFRGNVSGLTLLMGLSPAKAKRAGARWVEMKAGTNEYKNFRAEDTISALPASILPIAGNAVTLAKEQESGRVVDLLSWQDTTSGSGSKEITEKLVLRLGLQPLPLREVTTVGGDTQTVTFTNWGRTVNVALPNPSAVVPYSLVASG